MRHRLFLPVLLGLAPAFAFADDCRFSAQRDFDVDAAGLAAVEFALGSSDLHVEGVSGLARVEVRGHACASSKDLLDGLAVEQRRAGDRLVVTARVEHAGGLVPGRAWIDLRVRMPASLAVVSAGSSADVDARGIASLDFTSSSGDLVAERIAGTLATEASSGDVRAREIGSFEARATGSGDISASTVHGDAKVASAGSGDLSFADVEGSVVIGRVGSGDLQARRVRRNVEVGSIGSGDVSVDDVGGDLRVDGKGSGDIEHRDVRGTVSIPRRD